MLHFAEEKIPLELFLQSVAQFGGGQGGLVSPTFSDWGT